MKRPIYMDEREAQLALDIFNFIEHEWSIDTSRLSNVRNIALREAARRLGDLKEKIAREFPDVARAALGRGQEGVDEQSRI